MKTVLAALALLAVLIACLLATICCAENESRFQSLGGDFGRDMISTLKGAQTQAAANESSGNGSELWNWGNAPKGSLVQNGKLVTDPLNTWKSLNYTDGWIGQVEVDPFTGNPIYAYEIPDTGETKYFYIDPYTKEPIYVERGSTAGGANYAASSSASGSYKLPPVFS
jgi:hypothetical protein